MAEIDFGQVNDKSLEIVADIWDPYCALMRDTEFTKLYTTNLSEAIKYACRKHKEEVIEIAAVLEGKKVEDYVVNPFRLPVILLTAIGTYSQINKDLFTSQGQNTEEASSGSATVNTEAKEQQNDS